MFDKPIIIISIEELYSIQHEILTLLTYTDIELHMVSGEHACGEDKQGFLKNSMERYKCIIIPTTLRDDALQFANIIQNETGREILFFCCVCGHQNM